MIDAVLFVLVLGAVSARARRRCRGGNRMDAAAMARTRAMKYPRTPATPPPPESVHTGIPGVPVDKDGKPNREELPRRWGGYFCCSAHHCAGTPSTMYDLNVAPRSIARAAFTSSAESHSLALSRLSNTMTMRA